MTAATLPLAHEPSCPHRDRHPDAAKRVSDQYNLHLIGAGFDAAGKVFAASLADGRSDGVLYDSMAHAVAHQRHNEARYAFVRIGPASMSVCEAAGFLRAHQAARSRGIDEPDRDHKHGGRVLIPRLTVEDQIAQVNSILFGTPPTNLIQPHD